MFIFVLYDVLLINTTVILSIFNYLRKFDGRVLYPHSWSKGFYDALDKKAPLQSKAVEPHDKRMNAVELFTSFMVQFEYEIEQQIYKVCGRMEKREKHKGCSCGEYLLWLESCWTEISIELLTYG